MLPLAILIVILVVALTFVYAALSGAPWVPTFSSDVRRSLQAVGIRPGMKLYDLGCGDGRLVAAAARLGAQAIGLEISILPFVLAKLRLLFVRGKASVKYADFWQVDISDADVVYAFLLPKTMEKLKSKFERELKSGAKVVSSTFAVKGWTPDVVDKVDGRAAMYVYIMK